MNVKQLIKCVAFIMATLILCLCLCDVFEIENYTQQNRRYYTYTKLEKNTVDAVILGTSGIHSYFVPSKAYEDYGMTVYPLSIDAFPAYFYIELIKDARCYQNPELFIIDIRSFTQTNDGPKSMETPIRYTLDAMPLLSVNRLAVAFKGMKIMHRADPKSSRYNLSYLFSFIKYHKKWNEDTFRVTTNIRRYGADYLGFYYGETRTVEKVEINPKEYNPNFKIKLDDICYDSLYELIKFIKKNNLNVLFIDTPQARTKLEYGRSNTVYEILEQENMPYKHYYTTKTKTGISNVFNFNYKEDFYNDSHTNFYGAIKFTDVFARYLKEKYNLKDRKNDTAVKKNWDNVHTKLVEDIKALEIKRAKQKQEELEKAELIK